MSNDSCFYGDNIEFIEEIYQKYLQGDKSIGEDWHKVFSSIITSNETEINPLDKKNITVNDLATTLTSFFRSYGHFFANLNPLSKSEDLTIDYQKYSNISNLDFEKSINLKGMFNREEINIGDFISILKDLYCKKIGFEFMHISSYEEKLWLQEKIENRNFSLNAKEKKEMLQHLIESEMFEQFLHMKFPGYKRFSIEGGESAIVAIEKIISKSTSFGIEEIVLGMAHRGRLNVLTKILGKEYFAMLSEFQGNSSYPDKIDVSGDVKYHLGFSSDRKLPDGRKIHLSLCYNPSHLEAVNPVLAGRVRAKQNTKSVLGLSIHGDAAFIGQGVVAETLSLSNIEGYKVGGILHIVINNQVGFTANPCCARSSFYCTDIAKLIDLPVFHVNGDDPEVIASYFSFNKTITKCKFRALLVSQNWHSITSENSVKTFS